MVLSTSNLISVIVPVWNGADYIGETVESILKQKVRVEIIAIDDGSTDTSRDVLSTFACKLVPISHSGIARACNTGFQHATGEYLMILDQDDLLLEGALQVLLDAFLLDDKLKAVSAMARDFISPDLHGASRESLLPRKAPYYGLMSGCLLFHRSVPSIVGNFNESYRAGQAVDYMLRIQQYGIPHKKLDFVSAMRRLHANNTSRTMKTKQFNDYTEILRSRLIEDRKNG